MKRTIIILATVIFVIAIGLGIYNSQSTKKSSDLVSLNIEALAYLHGCGGSGGFNCWCCTSAYCDPRNGYPIYYTVQCCEPTTSKGASCCDVPYNFSEGSFYCWVD